MNLSPIQLIDYHLLNFRMDASPTFELSQQIDLDPKDLEVSVECVATKEDVETDSRKWVVDLTLRHEAQPKMNIPYSFSIRLSGIFTYMTSDDIADEIVNHSIEVNGPSMLFGICREIVREATGRGPYGPMMLPSASFFSPPPKIEGDRKKRASSKK